MNPSSSPLIKVADLTRTYVDGTVEVHALRGVDLSIEAGEFTALAGPSGSGKTTLLNMIGVLDRPTGGRVVVDGTDVSDLGRAAAADYRLSHIGFVFQAYNLIPVLSAYENAELVLRLQGVPAERRAQMVNQLLEDVGLKGMGHRRPNELSGGQQQRVAIARAIASSPAVTLADEPTANVDSATAEVLLGLMEKLNRERGVTFIFSTHDPRVMARARRIVHLVDGQVDHDERRE